MLRPVLGENRLESLQARTTLENRLRAFTGECFSAADLRARENAIVLVQVYNAYAAIPKLDWLKVPGDIIESSRGFTRLFVRRGDVSDMNAIELVVNAIIGSAAIYRNADKGQSQLAKALAARARADAAHARSAGLKEASSARSRWYVLDRQRLHRHWPAPTRSLNRASDRPFLCFQGSASS
jgi:hypothetical protein